MDFVKKKPHKCRNVKYLTIFYQNVRGLRSKLDVCKISVISEFYDVYALTETFLNSSNYSQKDIQ